MNDRPQQPDTPLITIGMIFGDSRERAAANLAKICAQTGIERAEVIAIDADPGSGEIDLPDGPIRLIELESEFGEARARVALEARGQAVAYLEDHCYPLEGWLEGLIEAWSEAGSEVGSIGYAFATRADDDYPTRVTLQAEYGEWIEPVAAGPVRRLPGNNISYSAEVLRDLDEGEGRLAHFLSADAILHNELAARGIEMRTDPRARVYHRSLPSVRDSMSANYLYSRQLAANQAELNRWSLPRRVLWSILAPLGAPAIRMRRLIEVVGARRVFGRRNGRLLPGVLAVFFAASFGQATGYVAGRGDAGAKVAHWELEAERS